MKPFVELGPIMVAGIIYHAAGVCGGDTVDYGTPDVEIMACSAHWVRVALAAFTSASNDIVSV